MVFVNDPPIGAPFSYRQLVHSPWDGVTFADVIFPVFLFVVGASMAFSLDRMKGPDGRPVAGAYRRMVRRCVLLFALGLVDNGLPLLWSGGSLSDLRVMGVLQRIALTYLLAGLLVLNTRWRTQVVVGALTLVGYWALLRWVPVPGHGHPALTPAVNLPGWLDRSVFGAAHLYGQGRPGYDPEGLLSTLPATVSVLIGYWSARLLRARPWSRPTAPAPAAGIVLESLFLGAAGLAILALGRLWELGVPLNKRMWTSSYVLVMAGWSVLALALLHLVLDRPRGRWVPALSLPLKVLGANAIVVYMGTELAGDALGTWHHLLYIGTVPDRSAQISLWLWGRYLVPTFGHLPSTLVYSAAILAAWWLVAAVMYRRRVFLRV